MRLGSWWDIKGVYEGELSRSDLDTREDDSL